MEQEDGTGKWNGKKEMEKRVDHSEKTVFKGEKKRKKNRKEERERGTGRRVDHSEEKF